MLDWFSIPLARPSGCLRVMAALQSFLMDHMVSWDLVSSLYILRFLSLFLIMP